MKNLIFNLLFNSFFYFILIDFFIYKLNLLNNFLNMKNKKKIKKKYYFSQNIKRNNNSFLILNCFFQFLYLNSDK